MFKFPTFSQLHSNKKKERRRWAIAAIRNIRRALKDGNIELRKNKAIIEYFDDNVLAQLHYDKRLARMVRGYLFNQGWIMRLDEVDFEMELSKREV